MVTDTKVSGAAHKGTLTDLEHAQELDRLGKEFAGILDESLAEMGIVDAADKLISCHITEHEGSDHYGDFPIRIHIDSRTFDGGWEGKHSGAKLVNFAAGVFVGAFKAKYPMLDHKPDMGGMLKHGGMTIGFENMQDALQAINALVGDNRKIRTPLAEESVVR